jgi:hypothetical protein
MKANKGTPDWWKNKTINDEQTVNKHGNIERERYVDASRALYDWNLCKASEGWQQYDTDQDAWYFGVWINPAGLMIVTYAEGDRTLTICPSKDRYDKEIDAMNEFYGAQPPMAVAIGGGTTTKYYDNNSVNEGRDRQ